jgi:hypothetical protein
MAKRLTRKTVAEEPRSRGVSKDGPRKGSSYDYPFSRPDLPELCIDPSRQQRAQGRPDAGCTRGLVCIVESTRVIHHRFNRSDPAFPAQWC